MNNPTNPLDTNLDLLWPKKGDVLVTADGDAAFLVRTRSDQEWETYVAAYKMAADMLVERTHDMTLSINWLVFPIWYLYRHYFELRLKSLIWDGDALDGQAARTLNNEHRLMTLWGMCRQVIQKHAYQCPKSDLDAVEEMFSQFEAKDPQSQAARYTENRSGNPSPLLGIQINVKTFAETATKAANFLDAVSDEFSRIKSDPY